jgi:hypothetical protein
MTTKPSHLQLSDLRGAQRLATAATLGITDLVEALHHTILRSPHPLGNAPQGQTGGITGLVYKSVRGITRLVGGSVDALLGLLAPLVADRPSSQERETLIAVLNGLFGDYLHDSHNPLAIRMQFRKSGTPLVVGRAALAAALPDATGKIVVLVHGLCLNDLQWTRDGHDHGAMLAHETGFTPVYLHYDTGRHISSNGRELDAQLETLLREWPVPVERLALLTHSMGGLVARSACHYAAERGSDWLRHLDAIVFLGAPHLGAPLERAGAWGDFLLRISPYTAPFERLGKARSAGIKDLRHGSLRDEDWQPDKAARRHARASVPLRAGIRCTAIAASKSTLEAISGARIRSDGLVPVSSALGRHRDPALDLALPDAQREVIYGIDHFDLLSDARVSARIRTALA